MEIENGWLKKQPNVEAILKNGLPTKHHYSLYSDKPLGVCWHYSNPVWSSLTTSKEVCELLLRDKANASWHGMLSKEGYFYQCVSFNRGSWHVGKPGVIKGKSVDNVNRYLIGIELENEGRLKKIDGEFYSWPWKKDPLLKSKGVLIAKGEFKNCYFAPFTESQVSVAKDLIIALKTEYNFTKEDFLYDHHQFDPSRKDDIGPIWMDQILPQLLKEVYDV